MWCQSGDDAVGHKQRYTRTLTLIESRTEADDIERLKVQELEGTLVVRRVPALLSLAFHSVGHSNRWTQEGTDRVDDCSVTRQSPSFAYQRHL